MAYVELLRAGLDTGSRRLPGSGPSLGRFTGRLLPAAFVRLLHLRVSFHAAAAAAIMLLAGCASTPVVTAVDTLCVSTSRPPITEAQRAAFKADRALWEPLVDWLGGFLKVRDGACLKPTAGP